MKLAPSTAPAGIAAKLAEGLALLRQYRARKIDLSGYFANIVEYDQLLRRYACRELASARVFEIGFGARPHRLAILMSMGVDASGVDAEVPVLRGSPSEFWRAYRANGAERVAKSLVRHVLFDRADRRALVSELAARGLRLSLDVDRLEVGDAADVERAEGSVDLVISEDVFEHLWEPSLGRLVAKLPRWLGDDGLALIRPNVFTGITGGHLIEWSRASLATPGMRRRSEPWEHLRRDRFKANTSLNRLTRADYRTLFTRAGLEILEERVKLPDLGREFLTPDVAEELRGFSEVELFSNQVLFVLRRAGNTASPSQPVSWSR